MVIHQNHKGCNMQIHNFTLVLYVCEIRTFILREEHRLRVYDICAIAHVVSCQLPIMAAQV
jgi:hypothetical protein